MKRGFTLIDLLVSLSIISLLASLSLASFSVTRDKAKRARARFEIIQIFKAAELVFHEKRYYPNDYHGSVICPGDIVIDDSSGTTFNKYINICNDINGNAYLWNNLCGSNGKERGNHQNCDAFSDTDPGPIGVIYVGKNGINDLCTFDDICFGKRTFPNFSLSDDECDFECIDTGLCTDITDESMCNTQEGCKWIGGNLPSAYCEPQNPCNTHNIETCNSKYSCSWAEGEC